MSAAVPVAVPAALTVGCAAALAVTFGVSAVAKLRDGGAFRRSLPATARVPARFAGPVAVAVVTAESVLTVALAAAVVLAPDGSVALAVAGFAGAVGLLVAFTVVVVGMIRRGTAEPCRCFGAASTRPPGRVDVARNVALTLVSVLGLGSAAVAADSTAGALAGASSTSAWAVVAVAVGVGVTVALCLISLDELVWLAGSLTS